MMDHIQLLECVPVGKDNALPITDIWMRLGMWSHHSVRAWLKKLADCGDLQMEIRPYRRGSARWVFWREAA